MPQGIITALITPFKEDGTLDEPGLRMLIKRQVEARVFGIAVLGTTGEAPTLTPEEKETVVRTAVQVVARRCCVMVGTGTNCTKTSLANTVNAAHWGADMALVISPYYNRPSSSGLKEHFIAVADGSPIPLCLYNHPGRCGVHLDLEIVRQLASHPQIIALKEASGDIRMLDRIACETDLHVFAGDDALTAPAMALGAVGTISVLANLLPEAMVDLVERDDRLALHRKLSPLFELSCIDGNPASIKAMMDAEGLPAGKPRLPLVEAREEIKTQQSVWQPFLSLTSPQTH